MMIYPMPMNEPTVQQSDPLKDGLSERKPLFDGWGDSRVPQTPRMRHIEPHNQEKKPHA